MFTLVFRAKAFTLHHQSKENKHLKKTIAFLSQIPNYPSQISQIHSNLWVSKAYSMSSIVQSIINNEKEILVSVFGILAI